MKAWLRTKNDVWEFVLTQFKGILIRTYIISITVQDIFTTVFILTHWKTYYHKHLVENYPTEIGQSVPSIKTMRTYCFSLGAVSEPIPKGKDIGIG